MRTGNKNRIIQVVAMLVMAFCLGACKKTLYRPEELVTYVQDTSSGFTQAKTFGDLDLSVQFLPSSYNALIEMGRADFSEGEYQRTESEYEGSYAFRFRLKHHSGLHPLKAKRLGQDEWYMLKKYFDFDISKDVKLIQGNDTADCSIHHHFYNDMSPELEIMFLFDKKKVNGQQNLTFVYDDQLYDNGYVLFEFDKEVIHFSPQIKF